MKDKIRQTLGFCQMTANLCAYVLETIALFDRGQTWLEAQKIAWWTALITQKNETEKPEKWLCFIQNWFWKCKNIARAIQDGRKENFFVIYFIEDSNWDYMSSYWSRQGERHLCVIVVLSMVNNSSNSGVKRKWRQRRSMASASVLGSKW